MKRVLVLLTVIVIGLAAPARAWCEASCTTTSAAEHAATGMKPHCPTHSEGTGTRMSASEQDQCRAIDVARAQNPARLDSVKTHLMLAGDGRTLAPSQPRTFAPSHLRSLAPPPLRTSLSERSTPLRI